MTARNWPTAIDTALSDEDLAIDASYDSVANKIVLTAQDASVLASALKRSTIYYDLVADVQRALDHVGLASVTAARMERNLILTEADGKTLEISKTISLDAGFHIQELQDTLMKSCLPLRRSILQH